jgi:eukaryotic-like serine/threonine-protein kinase
VIGERVGDYMIESELGFEETGSLYLGTHVVLPRRAAIKVMHAGRQRGTSIQVLRQACLLEALAHPGIPRIYECGVLADRRPWAAMEHVDGRTLGAELATGPLALTDLTVAIRDVADLLAHVHARGVVHRRLTADAIVCTPDRPFQHCIRDWGDALTLDSELVHVDARDDVHALGVIAYRALVGSLPARGVSALDRCPAAPVELTAVIDRMLADDPTARPTAREVRDRARWLAATLVPLVVPPQLVIEDEVTVRFAPGKTS